MYTMFKNMNLQDLKATYNSEARLTQLQKNIQSIEYYNGNVDIRDLFEKQNQFFAGDLHLASLHRQGNTRLDYLLSTIKRHLRIYEEMIYASDLDPQLCMKFIINIRRISDVRESLIVQHVYKDLLDDINSQHNANIIKIRQLTSRVNRLLNVLEHPALIFDTKGNIQEVNDAAVEFFALWNREQQMDVLSLLDFHYASFKEFLASYDNTPVRQLGFTNGEQLTSKLIKLDRYSYMLIFMNMKQREAEPEYTELSSSEYSIFELVNKGMTSKQIADKLHLSEETVKTHRKQIRRKLGIVNQKISIANHSYKK